MMPAVQAHGKGEASIDPIHLFRSIFFNGDGCETLERIAVLQRLPIILDLLTPSDILTRFLPLLHGETYE